MYSLVLERVQYGNPDLGFKFVPHLFDNDLGFFIF